MFRKFTHFAAVAVLVLSLLAGAVFAAGRTLAYRDVPTIASYFFYSHVSKREFTDELYLRTVKNFIKILDPTKVFFLAADVEGFESVAKASSSQLMADFKSGNMNFFIDINKKFRERLDERQKRIESLITENFQPLPAKDTENLDSPEVQYSKTTEELELRIKKILSLQFESLKSAKKTPKEIASKLQVRYRDLKKFYDGFDDPKLAGIILKSFAMGLDPHSLYFSPEELENFNIQFKLSLEGIGATLRNEDGYTIIDSLIPGSPAKKSGKLKTSDKIIAVGQENGDMLDVIGMDIDKVVQKIRGPKGTRVRLSILREKKNSPAEQFLVVLVRDKIKLVDSAVKSEVKVIDGKKYGVINVPSFYEDMEGVRKHVDGAASCSNDVRRALAEFKDTGEVEGVVLDLRSNTGGSLNEAVKMTGLFITHGVVVMVKNSSGAVQELPDDDPGVYYKGPLVVLVNKLSASASEIVAAALKDYGRAVVAGDTTTYGKGSVQTMLPLPDGYGAIKVTNSLYYTAGGASTQKKGVPIDVVIPSATEEFKAGESTVDYALDWSVLSSAIPKIAQPGSDLALRDASLDAIIPKLVEDSRKRVEANPKFKELADKNGRKKKAEEDAEKEENGDDTDETSLKKKDDVVLDEALSIVRDIKALSAPEKK